MPHAMASDLGLHCLPMSHKWNARLIWVKPITSIGEERAGLCASRACTTFCLLKFFFFSSARCQLTVAFDCRTPYAFHITFNGMSKE